MLLESTRLPFDPKILCDCHSDTPICQNSVLLPYQTHISLAPSRNPHRAVRTPFFFFFFFRKRDYGQEIGHVPQKGDHLFIIRNLLQHVRVKQGQAILKPCCSGIIVTTVLSVPYGGKQIYAMQTVTALILMDTSLHVHGESHLIWNHTMTVKLCKLFSRKRCSLSPLSFVYDKPFYCERISAKKKLTQWSKHTFIWNLLQLQAQIYWMISSTWKTNCSNY